MWIINAPKYHTVTFFVLKMIWNDLTLLEACRLWRQHVPISPVFKVKTLYKQDSSVWSKMSHSHESVGPHWPAVAPSVIPSHIQDSNCKHWWRNEICGKGARHHDWDFYLARSKIKHLILLRALFTHMQTHTVQRVRGGWTWASIPQTHVLFHHRCYIASCLLMMSAGCFPCRNQVSFDRRWNGPVLGCWIHYFHCLHHREAGL